LADAFDLDVDKFSVIPNGVDPRFGSQADPETFRRHFGVPTPFLLNVANVEPRKNQRMLAQVARQLDVDLLLVGRARDPRYLAECLSQGGPRVRHLGFLDHADPLLASAYRACEVFVLPSLLETPGLAALEAATQGARLVVTSVGSTADYFEGLVRYVEPTNALALRRAIEDAWTAQRDDRLRNHVLANFTWTHAAKALVAAYNRTLLAAATV